ncbi:hypothetical protein K431DRAFT_286340 [Polychaeton citri CBS 116435]|uniref:Uncharacterized protein n=1 Tax=Polychaeton citri CBS 116435 TaxID=1314669 RepID=A0A9P4Q7H3_9PEZI|nr:hypothetical protein K431DRAFT_286340 [Polychaeton citri CBS 116435]
MTQHHNGCAVTLLRDMTSGTVVASSNALWTLRPPQKIMCGIDNSISRLRYGIQALSYVCMYVAPPMYDLYRDQIGVDVDTQEDDEDSTINRDEPSQIFVTERSSTCEVKAASCVPG